MIRRLVFGKKYIQPAPTPTLLYDIGLNTTTNGTVTRTTDHKGGNTAIQFGSGNLVSIDNLPASPVWSIAFWMKTTQSALGIIAELSENINNNRPGFIIDINEYDQNKMVAAMNSPSNYKVKSPLSTNINDGNWQHIVIIFNRNNTDDNEIKIFKNKEELVLSTKTYDAEMDGDFLSRKIYLGGRGDSYKAPFVGSTSPIKMFNYPLNQTEITNLYNE